MRRFFVSSVLALCAAAPLTAQPVEFDPSDFGKIVVAPRQSAGTGIVLEQAFGDYQNEPVISYGEKSIARRLGHPVGRLDVLYKNGKTGYCTAFIVDSEHLVTNNHCIPGIGDVGVEAAQFVAGYIDPAHPDSAEKFQVASQPLETSAQLDYSVLRVFGDPSARYGEVKLADADPEPSEFLWIIGHPQGQSQHISREGCAAGDPPVSTEGKVVHTCDTLGGNSGSPVFRISDRAVVALHHAGDNRTGFNFAIPMTRILKNSTILKAAAPAGPVGPVGPQGACEVLWGAAEQHGCLGYQTFLQQCGQHPLAPLAQGLAERTCKQAGGGPGDGPGTGPGTETAESDLKALRDEALQTADLRRRNVQLDIDAAGAHLQIANNLLGQMKIDRSAALSTRVAGAAEVVTLWEEAVRKAGEDAGWIDSRVKAMPRFLSQIEIGQAALRRAETEAELAVALEDVEKSALDAREWLTAIAARRKQLDTAYPETRQQAALILKKAAEDNGPDPRATLQARIDAALGQAAEARISVEANRSRAQKLLSDYESIISTAYAKGVEGQQSASPAGAEVAEHWQNFARGLAGEARRIRSRVSGMTEFGEEIDTAVSRLRSTDREEEVNDAAARIARALSTSNDWLKQVDDRYNAAVKRLDEANQKAALLLESTIVQRPAIATRCLELSMPTFALEGFEGVPGKDLDDDLALQVCQQATAVSDEPAVYYGLARAHLSKKQYGEAFRLLNNPRMADFIPAVWSLGSLYNAGLGVTKSKARAIEYYRRAAEADYPRGKFSLGVYYSYGWEVRADHVRAASLLVDSVADGYEYALTQLHKLPNATIREIQKELVQRGQLTSRDVDGAFGPTTRGALTRLLGQNAR